MAIAGITIRTTPEAYERVRERLGRAPGVADSRETGTPCILAAVLEAEADRIEGELGALSNWDGGINVGLVSVSYEDELEATGHIACPEHKPRKHGAACFEENPNPLSRS